MSTGVIIGLVVLVVAIALYYFQKRNKKETAAETICAVPTAKDDVIAAEQAQENIGESIKITETVVEKVEAVNCVQEPAETTAETNKIEANQSARIISLEKVDLLKMKTGQSYKYCRELLEKNNGDILDALLEWETIKPTCKERVSEFVKDAGAITRSLVKELMPPLIGVEQQLLKKVRAIAEKSRAQLDEAQLCAKYHALKNDADEKIKVAFTRTEELIARGKTARVRVRVNGKTLPEIPLVSKQTGAAVALSYIMPELVAIAIVAKLFGKIDVEIVEILEAE